jgi:hypothetical protein
VLAAAACNAAIRQNYQASCTDTIGAVHVGVTKQVRTVTAAVAITLSTSVLLMVLLVKVSCIKSLALLHSRAQLL